MLPLRVIHATSDEIKVTSLCILIYFFLLMSMICKRQCLPPMFWLDWQIPWVWPGPEESACSCGAKHRLSLRWTVGGRGLHWPQSCYSSFQKLELINASQVSPWDVEGVLLQSLFGTVIRKFYFAKSECHCQDEVTCRQVNDRGLLQSWDVGEQRCEQTGWWPSSQSLGAEP